MREIEFDADEFGRHIKAGGWRLGLLVARSVERGTAGRPRSNPGDYPDSVKVSASRFAELAGLSDHKIVTRYLDAWERAADIGQVPHAADLTPGQNVDIDQDRLGKLRVTDPDAPKAATVTATSTTGDTWSPSERSGTRPNNRYVGNGAEDDGETQTPGGLAHELIEKASDCLDRLATHRSSWQFMTESDYQTLGNLPAVIRRIMADVDMAGVKLKGR